MYVAVIAPKIHQGTNLDLYKQDGVELYPKLMGCGVLALDPLPPLDMIFNMIQ